MNKKEKIKKGKRITAVDIMIALLLILCIVGLGIRIAYGDTGIFQKNEQKEYVVSYVVSGISEKYYKHFAEGSEFSLENGETLGTLLTDAYISRAEALGEGEAAEGETAADSDLRDFRGTILVNGSKTDSGFLLNSRTYLAPNMTITVASPDITVELLITDIAPKAK